jgi:hypothetical protein
MVARGLARAEPDVTSPDVHVARARAAERRGELRRAVAELEAAYVANYDPQVLLALAAMHERLGERRAAAELLQRQLDTIESDELRDEILRRVNALAAAPSQVTFEVEPASATVTVDGVVIGTAPITRGFAAGNHEISIAASGHRPLHQGLVLEFGEPVTLRNELAPLEAPPSKPPSTPVEEASAPPPPHIRRTQVIVGSQWSLIPQDREGGSLSFGVGIRGLRDRLEVDGLVGSFGATIGRGAGAALRGYLATDEIRPYVAATAMFGTNRGYALGLGAVHKVAAISEGVVVFEAVLQIDLLTVRDVAPRMTGSAKIVVPVTMGLAVRI